MRDARPCEKPELLLPPMSEGKRWITVVVYGLAMAWFEAAAVTYLRTIVDRIDPYQAGPLPMPSILGRAELVREAATLIMLVAVGWLAGRTWRSRLAYAVIAKYFAGHAVEQLA